jgi:hypothetical protein
MGKKNRTWLTYHSLINLFFSSFKAINSFMYLSSLQPVFIIMVFVYYHKAKRIYLVIVEIFWIQILLQWLHWSVNRANSDQRYYICSDFFLVFMYSCHMYIVYGVFFVPTKMYFLPVAFIFNSASIFFYLFSFHNRKKTSFNKR